jgi:hypothetical protein
MFIENWPDEPQFGAAIRNASWYGGIGCIGVLTDTPDDNTLFYHGPRHDSSRMPCLNISPDGGRYLRSQLDQGPVRATLVNTNTRQQRWDRGTFHGIWGATYNVQGFLPGKTDEVIVIMSHHDGGAVNEASGTASVMALARYFSQFPKESRNKPLNSTCTTRLRRWPRMHCGLLHLHLLTLSGSLTPCQGKPLGRIPIIFSFALKRIYAEDNSYRKFPFFFSSWIFSFNLNGLTDKGIIFCWEYQHAFH